MKADAVAIAAAALAVLPGGAVAKRPPNVILVVADDLGYGELGCYGQTKIRTPNLDRLAAEGVRFTRFYSGAPVCAPSRCCLMTGKQPSHAIVRDNIEVQPEGQMALPAGTMTLARAMKQAGYSTGLVGKWGLGAPGSEGEPNRQGFGFFYGYLCQRQAHNYYPTHLWRNRTKVELPGNVKGNAVGKHYAADLMADEAVGWVKKQGDKPFLLCYTTIIPHVSLQIPEAESAPYRGKWDDPAYDGKKGYLPHPAPRAAYAAMISRLDSDVGRLVDAVRQTGVDKNTLVLFTSDNGPTHDVGGVDTTFFNSAGPLRDRKGSVYEGGLRVPLIAWWPNGIAPGRTSDHVAAFWDILPTLTDLAGAPRPAGVDGLSFANVLKGQGDQPSHQYLFWEFPGYGGQQAVILGDWKGVRRGMDDGNLRVELYDLANDIGEKSDVAAKHPEVVARIEAIMRSDREPSALFPMKGLDPGAAT